MAVASANFRINQVGHPALEIGSLGLSRDDLVKSLKCDLVPEDVDGVRSFRWTMVSAPKGSAAAISNPNAGSPSFIPDVEGSYLIEMVVNEGLSGQVIRLIAAVRFDEVTIGSFTGRLRLPAAGEDLESNWQSDFGFGPQLNTTGWWETLYDWLHAMQQAVDIGAVGGVVPLSRQVIAGAGLTGGGDFNADRTIDVVAGDGSITVGSNSISVGVLANDTQHGDLGGASLHSIVVSGGDAGFISGADKAKLDASIDGSRVVTAGAGLTGGGDLSVDRTFNVVANVDGSIIVAANSVRVGVINDTQHGTRGGGTQHALATGVNAGFISPLEKSLIASAVQPARTVTAGDGLAGGGALSSDISISATAHVDGSISIESDSIRVGVLSGDAQHGDRGGASQHALATTSVPGFMSAGDKVKANISVSTSRTLVAGTGLTGGGNLSANRTFNVGAHADGSIAIAADTVQVGVLATDTQHADRGGGTLHANATTSVAGFMSAADKVELGGTVNDARTIIAGDGLTGGGTLGSDVTINAAAHADGSIVVATNSIQVGILASDGQHADRGGGSLHANATTGTAGFMSASDKTTLNATTPSTRTISAGAGLTGGGNLTVNRTIDVVAGDGSITVNANDIRVGVISDTQHGARSGGSRHALATTSVHGFMSASDKTTLNATVPDFRSISAGSGLSGGGNLSANRTINVVASDGSIVVNANDISVGVINDTQHGTRAGGSRHALATTSVHGFLSATDKTKIDGMSGGAVSDHGALSGLNDISDHSWAALVDGSRDITGPQQFNGNVTLLSASAMLIVGDGSGNNDIVINKGASSNTGEVRFRTDGSDRWLIRSSSADNLEFGRYNVSGVFQDIPLRLNLSNGNATFANNVTLDSSAASLTVGDGSSPGTAIVSVVRNSLSPGDLRFISDEGGGDKRQWVVSNTSTNDFAISRHNDTSGVLIDQPIFASHSSGDVSFANNAELNSGSPSLTVGDGSGTPDLIIDSAPSSNGQLRFQTDGSNRWHMRSGLADDFVIGRYNLSGALLGSSIVIKQSSGDVEIPGKLVMSANNPTIEIGRGFGTANLIFIKGPSDWNELEFFSSEGGGQQRQWMIQHTSSNNLRITRRDALTGAYIDSVMSFDHDDGHLVAANNVVSGGQAYASTSSPTITSNSVTLDFDDGNISKFDGADGSTGAIFVTLGNMERGGVYRALFRQGPTNRALIWVAPGRTIKWDAILGPSPAPTVGDNLETIYKFIVHGNTVYAIKEWRDAPDPG